MSSRVMDSEEALKQANSHFVDENFEEALKLYNVALELDDSNPETFIKRSICLYKLEKFTASVSDANAALKLDPKSSKAYLRKGMALFSLEEYETAKVSFEKGVQLDPNNSQFKTWIRKCVAELEAEGQVSAAPISTPSNSQSTLSNPNNNNNNLTNNNNPTSSTQESKLRYEWYQTTTHVCVSVFIKGARKESTQIEYQEKSLSVSVKLDDSRDYNLDIDLCDCIVPSDCTSTFLSTKIEIKLKKANGSKWKSLEDLGEKSSTTTTWSNAPSSNSSNTKKSKNWDKIVDDVVKTEGPLDSEDSLNKVFQDIYANASEEQKKAMMKSFLESGGTVLSTNWDEVGKAPVKGSPPDGMEMHKWNE